MFLSKKYTSRLSIPAILSLFFYSACVTEKSEKLVLKPDRYSVPMEETATGAPQNLPKKSVLNQRRSRAAEKKSDCLDSLWCETEFRTRDVSRVKRGISTYQTLSAESLPRFARQDTSWGGLSRQRLDRKTTDSNNTKAAACLKIYKRLQPAYIQLASKRSPQPSASSSAFAKDQTNAVEQFLQMHAESCNDAKQRPKLFNAFTSTVSEHSGRIGIILPLTDTGTTGSRARYAQFILKGIRAALLEAGVQFDSQVLVRDSRGQPDLAEQQLADLVFNDKISIVIGGLDEPQAKILASYADSLMLPTLLLTRDRSLVTSSRYAFRVYPDQKLLAETLVSAAIKEGHKRVVILRPSTQKSDKIHDFFKAFLLAAGGIIVEDLVYTPNNFDSMQSVGRQLFKVDTVERAEEYRRAYQKAKRDAQLAKQPFDPRLVVLKPIIDFDAVFIPDDFRTVRHFAKLFKYYGVSKLPLIGNHEWRSPGLLDSYDDFLDGSLFADFIGSYTKLQASISAPTLSSPFFVAPEQTAAVDFQLIGYRSGRLASLAIKDKTIKRRHIAKAMQSSRSNGQDQFASGPYFTADHNSNWPTFIFRINNGGLTLESLSSPQLSKN